jgi:hypothetical protein
MTDPVARLAAAAERIAAALEALAEARRDPLAVALQGAFGGSPFTAQDAAGRPAGCRCRCAGAGAARPAGCAGGRWHPLCALTGASPAGAGGAAGRARGAGLHLVFLKHAKA